MSSIECTAASSAARFSVASLLAQEQLMSLQDGSLVPSTEDNSTTHQTEIHLTEASPHTTHMPTDLLTLVSGHIRLTDPVQLAIRLLGFAAASE